MHRTAHRWGRSALALAALTLTATVAAADADDRRRPEPPRRHEGPQVRFAIGSGGIYAHQSLDGGSEEISGSGWQFELALGEMVSESFALQLDLALFRAAEAESELAASTGFTAVVVGVGTTYWVMPQNIYLSGALGMASTTLEQGAFKIVTEEIPDLEVSDVGIGVHLAAGKQWWISQRTGLGLTASVLAMEMAAGEGEGLGPRWVLSGVAAVSLSYR